MGLKLALLSSLATGVLGVYLGMLLSNRGVDASSARGADEKVVGSERAALEPSQTPQPSSAEDRSIAEPLSKERSTSAQQGRAAVEGARAPADPAVLGELSRLRAEQARALQALETYKADIAALEERAGLTRARHQFDLDARDWTELGEKGIVKFRIPCEDPRQAAPGPEVMDRLGLAPGDAALLEKAYQHSRERLWSTLEPLCATALGGDVEKARSLGPRACRHLIFSHEGKGGAGLASIRRVSSVRAGVSPPPPPDEQTPLDRMLLALTEETQRFEAELAQTLGPEEAHELVFSQGLCFSESTHSLGPKPDRADGPRGLVE